MASKKRRESTDYVTHLARPPRPLRRGSAPVTAEYDLNNGRRMKLTYGQPIQTRNLKLYEVKLMQLSLEKLSLIEYHQRKVDLNSHTCMIER